MLDGDLAEAERALPRGRGRLRPARPARHALDDVRRGRRLRRTRRRLCRCRDRRARSSGHRDERRVRSRGASPGRCRLASDGCSSTNGDVGARRGGLRARARRRPPLEHTAGRVRSPSREWRSCIGFTVATEAAAVGRPRRWSCTGPEILAGSRTASTRRTTCIGRRGLCCVVLAAIAAEGDDPGRARPPCSARPRVCGPRPAPRSRRSSDDDIDRRGRAAVEALGTAAFSAAFERGRAADQVVPAG